MRRADRLFRLIQELRDGRLVTARTLAGRLEVSERTIYRDVADLVASGVPIDGAAGAGYVLRAGFLLPPLMFDRAEIEALAVGARMVEAWAGGRHAAGAASALAKIAAVLPPDLSARLAATPMFAPSTDAAAAIRARLDMLDAALKTRRIVVIVYRKETGEESERRVRPLGLFFWGGKWTLGAWCELRADFRTFRLDRISDGRATTETFSPEPDKSLSRFLRLVRGLTPGGRPERDLDAGAA